MDHNMSQSDVCSHCVDLQGRQGVNQSLKNSRQQCRHDRLFSLSLSSGTLPASWNDLIFWQWIVSHTKEGVQVAGQQDSDLDEGQDSILRSRTACLEALTAAKQYSRGS